MHLIDGKALAAKIRAEVKAEVSSLGFSPRLGVLLVGNDPASQLYVKLKRQAAEEVGIDVDIRELTANTPDHELAALIETWNQSPEIQAILVQLPLPAGHDENRIIATIDPKKDADGFHPTNVQALLEGNATIIPPVHEGILRLINESPLRVNVSRAVIFANSETFAAPLKRLMKTAGMSVDILSPTSFDRELLKLADVVVIAIGRLAFLKPDMVKDDAVIIDVGTNKTDGGQTRGDADLEAFASTNVWITPVPGGVGPMTIAQLLKNVVRLAKPLN